MSLSQAVQTIRQGGLCIFPTETFFGLGCDARNPAAVAALLDLKQRPAAQGLPLIIGSMAQLPLAASLEPGFGEDRLDAGLVELAQQLMQRFWPGPLSVVLPAAPGLASGVARQGSVALRFTPHPAAGGLCLQAGCPLVASSANLRGEAPVTEAKNLNPAVRQAAGALLDLPPSPAGGAPSTLALPWRTPEGLAGVRVLRQGAVPLAALEAAGCRVLPGQEGSGKKI